MEEELKFGADHYLRKLMDRKTMTEYFWSGLQFAMIFLALVSKSETTKLQNFGDQRTFPIPTVGPEHLQCVQLLQAARREQSRVS